MGGKSRKNLWAVAMAVIITLSFVVTVVPVYGQYEQSIQAVQPPGEGTAEEPFLVSSPEHFRWMGTVAGRRSGNHFVLVNDINVNFSITNFGGVFDGRGNTIHINKTISEGDRFTGIFGFSSGTGSAVIGNLHVAGYIINPGVRGGGHTLGGLIATNNGTIFNSSSSVTIITPTAAEQPRSSDRGVRIGGLVGNNYGLIINSYASGDVTGSLNVGGLVGRNRGHIINSFASGDVKGDENVGALVGHNSTGGGNGRLDTRIHYSYATGNVEWAGGRGEPNGIGGMVGTNADDAIIGNEPLIWLALGSRVLESSAVMERPELSDSDREALERLDAFHTILNHVRQVGWENANFEEAFGEEELTDIQRQAINQFNGERADIQQMERPLPTPGGTSNSTSNNTSLFDDGWGEGDRDTLIDLGLWEIDNLYGGNNSANRNLLELMNELGRGVIGEAIGLPLGLGFIEDWAIDRVLDIASWHIGQSRHLSQNRFSHTLINILR